MFSFVTMILCIIILIRLFKYDKFYLVRHDFSEYVPERPKGRSRDRKIQDIK